MGKIKQPHYDSVISGGGLVGLTLALALAPSGMQIAVIEPLAYKKQLDKKFDGRVSAIAFASRKVFEAIGIWKNIAEHAGEICDIRIVDNHSPLFLHYDHADIGDEPMGHIAQNRYIRAALYARLKDYKNITLFSPAACKKATYSNEKAIVELEDGRKLSTALVISAEGRNSVLKKATQIPTIEWDYGQSGIVCTVKHEKHHNGVAVEHFLPAGPFAILPMAGGHHSSLVWTEKTTTAPHYMKMNDKDFAAAIHTRFGEWLGKVTPAGGRWCYPLKLSCTTRYYEKRLVLVGDSAHAIHPIAGQGFNLGIRDVAQLAETLTETYRLGLDIGTETVLSAYEKARLADNAMMIAVTDGLNRLFSNNVLPIKLARQAGLAAVEKLPPLKKLFMRHAMGVSKTAPRLLQGKPL